jgi:hypothetical protein
MLCKSSEVILLFFIEISIFKKNRLSLNKEFNKKRYTIRHIFPTNKEKWFIIYLENKYSHKKLRL